MQQQMFLLATFWLCSPVLLVADDPQLSKDLPPVFGIATATKSMEAPSAVIIKVVVPAMTAEVRGKIVPKRSWPEAHVQVTPRNISVVIDPHSPSQLVGSEVVSDTGKAVTKDELLRRLRKPTVVLISTTGTENRSISSASRQTRYIADCIGPARWVTRSEFDATGHFWTCVTKTMTQNNQHFDFVGLSARLCHQHTCRIHQRATESRTPDSSTH